MSGNILQLIIQATNNTGGAFRSLQGNLQSATSEIKKQQSAVKSLQQQEAVRAAAARLEFAQKEKQRLAEIAFQKGTPTALLAAERATEKVKGAQAALNIAQEKVKLSQLGVVDAVEESERSGLGFAFRLNTALQLTQSVIQGVTLAFNELNKAFTEAANREVDVLAQQQTAAKTLGLSRQDAAKYVEEFNKQVSILGRDLPTSSEKINIFARTIQDDYANALRAAGASVKQVKDATISTATRIALASESANVDIGNTNAAIQAYLAGSISSIAGLNQYAFFANNTQLRGELEKQLKGSGKKGFGELSSLQRATFLTQGLEKAFTKEDIKELQGTAKSQLASFTDKLFDPITGIFSIQKDLDEKLPGAQSVYTSFKRTLTLTIGEGGILDQIGRLLGFNASGPMETLKRGVDSFNSFLEQLNNTLTAMKKFNGGEIGAAVGKFTAQATNIVFDGLLGALRAVDYGAVLSGATTGVGSFLVNLDWKVYLGSATALIGTALLPAILGAISSALTAAGVALASLLSASTIGATVVGIVTAIGAIVGAAPLAIGGAIVLGIAAVGKVIYDNWGNITKTVSSWNKAASTAISEFYTGTIDFWTGIYESSTKALEDGKKNLMQGLQSLITGVGDFFKNLFDEVVKQLDRVKNTILNPVGSITSAVSSFIPAPVSDAFNSATSFIGNTFNSITGGAKFRGYIPAANGLLSALNTEMARKPRGSDIVIANSTEAILTPAMLRNLVSGSVSVGRSGGNNITFQAGAVTLVLPAGTPEEIAMRAIQIIEERLSSELDSRLAI